jgi:hypothetical protein
MVLVVILVRMFSLGSSNVKELNSQQILAAVNTHQFITNPDNRLTLHDQSQELKGGQKVVYYPHNYDIAAVLNKAGTPFLTDPRSTGIWLSVIGRLAPILLIVLFFILFMDSMRGDGNRIMSFGKSKAKQISKDSPKVTFSDVTRADEAVQELTEIKEFLEAPQKFQKPGATIPTGVLLVGPPETGKTLLATESRGVSPRLTELHATALPRSVARLWKVWSLRRIGESEFLLTLTFSRTVFAPSSRAAPQGAAGHRERHARWHAHHRGHRPHPIAQSAKWR